MDKIDRLLAQILVLSIMPFLLNCKINIMINTIMVLLLLRMVISKNLKGIILIILTGGIILYNYYISKSYFSLNLNILNEDSNKIYAKSILTFILMLYIFSNKYTVSSIYKHFKKYSTFVLVEIILCQIFILIKLITKSGYIMRWGMSVFVGPFLSPHPYVYSLIIMIILIELLIIEKKNNFILFLYIVPLYTSILTGARTPTIILFLFFISVRFFKDKNRFCLKNKHILIFIAICIIFIIIGRDLLKLLFNSNLISKFSSSENILNSRDMIWQGLLNDFNTFSIKEKILGHGIHYTVLLNLKNVKSSIWGHSDFIDILISYGILLMIIYIVVYLNYFKYIFDTGMNKKLVLGTLLYMILLSVFNGVVNYNGFISIVCYFSIFCEATVLRNNITKQNGEDDCVV